MLVLVASACQRGADEDDLAYYRTASVPTLGWTNSDTLFFPIRITQPTTLRTPLVQGHQYQMGYSVRMSSSYPLTRVPMQLVVQQTDTAGTGREYVVRNVLRRHIAPVVRDTLGHPLGPSWGSLIDYEGYIDDVTIQFDSLGTYRMMLIPALQGRSRLTGLSAIGIMLFK